MKRRDEGKGNVFDSEQVRKDRQTGWLYALLFWATMTRSQLSLPLDGSLSARQAPLNSKATADVQDICATLYFGQRHGPELSASLT